jgi:hypothetical protein
MPGKSRHGKRKRPTLSKRRNERQHSLPSTSQQGATAQTLMPVHVAGKVNPKANIPATSTNPDTSAYRYIKYELLKISIITGIIMAIMAILVIVFKH